MLRALVSGSNGLGSGILCCVLGQDTLLSQCLSPPRWLDDGLASHSEGSRNTPSRFMLQKPEYAAA